MSIIEAQAAGKYVVATNVGGIEDVLHPQCGLLSEVSDHKKYCENLLSALHNYKTNAQFAQQGTNWALQKFSYQRLVNDVKTLYENLLTKFH